MDPAGVVADHAAEGAPAMRRWIRTKGQVVLLGRGAQVVEDQTRLDPGKLALRVDRDDVPKILGEVENDRDVAALPGEARPGAAGQDRGADAPAYLDRLNHVGDVTRDDDPDR